MRNYKDRRLTVTTRHQVVRRNMGKDCPQGSIIGPIVWNMVMDKLLKNQVESCDYMAYADDLLVLIHGNSRKKIELKALQVFIEINSWTMEHKLKMSSEKTKAILFKGNLNIS